MNLLIFLWLGGFVLVLTPCIEILINKAPVALSKNRPEPWLLSHLGSIFREAMRYLVKDFGEQYTGRSYTASITYVIDQNCYLFSGTIPF
jgi:hypothetical protein